MDRAWDMLVSEDASNADMFFTFLRSVLHNHEWVRTNSQMLQVLFEEKVLRKTDLIQKGGIQLTGF